MHIKLTEQDEAKLNEIHVFITKDVKAHHTIPYLSRKFAINEFKLKTGFKQMFGTPLFQCLQDLRMEKAKGLLEQGETITKTAKEVGYDHTTNFSAAFKRKFHQTPMQYRQAAKLVKTS